MKYVEFLITKTTIDGGPRQAYNTYVALSNDPDMVHRPYRKGFISQKGFVA